MSDVESHAWQANPPKAMLYVLGRENHPQYVPLRWVIPLVVFRYPFSQYGLGWA